MANVRSSGMPFASPKRQPIMGMRSFGLLSVCLSFLTTSAFAAGIVCDNARSAPEKAICADEGLRQLDVSLASAYAGLLRAQPAMATEFRQQQKSWLKVRDQCADEQACLRSRYEDRLAALITQRRALPPYEPDDVDRRALQALRSAVEERLKTAPEFPLEKTLEALRITDGTTAFFNEHSGEDSSSRFPVQRPKGVSTDEWAALRKSKIDAGGENGAASYILLDVDGDGLRDLIVDSYVGGTGLFNYISVLRRRGAQFEGGYVSPLEVEDDSVALYSINGRGSNQAATWIRLEGRVYAAYRNSYFGEDNLFLLRPFVPAGKVPILRIRYRYTWSVPRLQKSEGGESTQLDARTHAALSKALRAVDGVATGADRPENATLCPVPKNVDEALRSDYASFGPGHYTIEIVRDLPVWLGKECHLGQVIDWFGAYSPKEGLFAILQIRKPGESEGRSFNLQARRRVTHVESDVGLRTGDAGM